MKSLFRLLGRGVKGIGGTALSFFGGRFKMIGMVVGVAAVVSAIGGYLYFDHQADQRKEEKIEALSSNVATLETAYQTTRERANTLRSELDGLASRVSAYRAKLQSLEEQTQAARRDLRAFEEHLSGLSIEEMANEDPEDLERRINSGSARIGELLERVSDFRVEADDLFGEGTAGD